MNSWLEIKFNTDIPIILTGQVTNIEEDMIEIKTWPRNQVIYIDMKFLMHIALEQLAEQKML